MKRMDALRFLKRQVRRYPQLTDLLQPPVVRATVALRRFRMARWYGGRLRTTDAMNAWIAQRINDGIPSAIGKLGTLEHELLAHDDRRGAAGERRPIPAELRRQAFVNVGLFPDTDAALYQALDQIRSALASVDGMAVYGMAGEDLIVRQDCTRLSALCEAGGLGPWHASHPWSAALHGKRVLVVHPFVDTIRGQYQSARRRIWQVRPEILPEFGELLTLRVPLSPGLVPPQEPDWSERLRHLRQQMDGLSFDVALIGAGGMSLPLAAHARSHGACGIHMGGNTQILFGVLGKRWDDQPELRPYFNDAWVRPSAEETPTSAVSVEGGCYW